VAGGVSAAVPAKSAIANTTIAALQGSCWRTTAGDFVYAVCPFSNVTQAAVKPKKGEAPVLLG
jgi:hypothetical protein